MEITVASILHAPENVTRYPFHERIELPSDDERLKDAVDGELVITRAGSKVLQAQGAFHAELLLNCDRCGNEFELPLDFELDESLEVTTQPITSLEVEEVVPANGSLNATDLIRQGLLLSLPSRRLCGCEPQHGSAGEAPLDPRWAALKSFEQSPNGHN